MGKKQEEFKLSPDGITPYKTYGEVFDAMDRLAKQNVPKEKEPAKFHQGSWKYVSSVEEYRKLYNIGPDGRPLDKSSNK